MVKLKCYYTTLHLGSVIILSKVLYKARKLKRHNTLTFLKGYLDNIDKRIVNYL